MKVALMWSINNFPTYEMLSGWVTHGKLACFICMEDSKAFTLKFGEKASWFDLHRKFLPYDNLFKRNKNAYFKGVIESCRPPIRLTSEQICD